MLHSFVLVTANSVSFVRNMQRLTLAFNCGKFKSYSSFVAFISSVEKSSLDS